MTSEKAETANLVVTFICVSFHLMVNNWATEGASIAQPSRAAAL